MASGNPGGRTLPSYERRRGGAVYRDEAERLSVRSVGHANLQNDGIIQRSLTVRGQVFGRAPQNAGPTATDRHVDRP